MTTLIESTSSALPLRERAIRARREREAALDAENAERQRSDLARKLDVLRIHLRDKLGITDGVTVSERRSRFDGHVIDVGPYVEVVATVEDLNFTLRERSGDYRASLEALHVQVPCERECGKDLWYPVDSLVELGEALDADYSHKFACLQKFDEEGEPTTDREGNPLPPRGPWSDPPASSSPWQRANGRIASIEDAAREMAIAQDRVTRFEDERAPLKAAAIKRLMSQTNDLTGKLHSASSAEAVVELDADYAAYRAMQRDAEVERHRTVAAYEIAKITARLAVESFVVEERNR
jgi:hypothetical protein